MGGGWPGGAEFGKTLVSKMKPPQRKKKTTLLLLFFSSRSLLLKVMLNITPSTS
jgi:hypothetical protein